MRTLAIAAVAIAASGCGTGRDVSFVVETEGEARATEVTLRVDAEIRLYEEVRSGERIRRRDVMDGTAVELQARNGGDEGAVVVYAFIDGCAVREERCQGAGCVTTLALEVHEACD